MSLLGTRVVRVEDPELLTVGGKYVEDLAPPDALYATFVRSTVAHAAITGIDTSDAAEADGVVAVYTAADLGLEEQPPRFPMLNADIKRAWLSTDKVRYVGEPVAVVLSTTREAGVDAAELVYIDYDFLPALIDPAESAKDEHLLFPEAGTNINFAIPSALSSEEDEAAFFDGCDVTVSLQFRNQRLAPCPIEGRAAIAKWGTTDDGREHLTQWSTTQGAHGTRDTLAGALGLETDQVRVICPDVGGGFGAKNGGYPEHIVTALAARKLGRPVLWSETRTDSMLGLVHGRACDFDATIGGTSDGKILAYKVHMLQDSGGYQSIGGLLPFITKMVATGPYDIAKVDFSATSVMTNTVPVGAYRGAGRPEAAAAVDRMVDLFAHKIGKDPLEVRRINAVAAEDFPYTTPTDVEMDTGEYHKAMDMVEEYADYAALRAQQAAWRNDPSKPLLGLGWCLYVEIANPLMNQEFGSIQVRPDGSAVVLTGSSAHGQGHHTAFAQVAADRTGIPFDKIEVRHGDTDEVERGGGTGGSKSLQLGGSAVANASDALVARAKDLAADLLEANPADIELDVTTGAFHVAGTPTISTGWAEVAAKAEKEAGGNPFLETADFVPPGATFPFGVHLSVVEVDRETGEVTIARHIALDDCGIMANPMLVEGQVHGGVASGIAQALVEEFAYDADGNPLTSNFLNYGLISTAELPSFERLAMETPTPRNPLGAKGIGESGTIGSTPAVQNAVIDALAHMGVTHVDIPVTAERVWRVIQDHS